MLSEQTIERLTERLVERIESQNVQVIKQIGQSIIKLGQLSPSKAQQLIQILRYGGDYDKIIREIKRITKLNIKDIEQIFREVAKQDYQFAEQFYKYRNKKYIPFDENRQLQNQVKALIKAAVKDYYNLTKTSVIGFTVKDPIHNTTIFKDLKQTYIDALDKAVLSISQGKTTFQDELHQIVRTLGKSGLKTVDYESGKSMRLDSAVRMNIKGALRELHNEMQKIIGKQFDADGVEISVHEYPAPDHAEAQGRQFSKREFEKLQETGIAKTYDGLDIDLHLELKSGKTSESFRPISKYNCYHYTFEIVLGVSEPEYSNEQLQKIIDDNNKGFTYKGKHYTMYEGTQMQRRMETQIRKLKDQQIFAKQTGDEELANQTRSKIRVLSKQYKQFSEISHLSVKKDRLRVSGYGRTKFNVSDQNQNIITASHFTTPENYNSIMKQGFKLDKSGSQAGSTFGKGTYFATDQNEMSYWQWRIDNSKEIKADIDTTDFLKVEYDDYTHGNSFVDKVVKRFNDNQKKEYNKLLKQYREDNKIASELSNKGDQNYKKYWHINEQQDAMVKILERDYPGLIIKQNTPAIDIITGGNQIVVYDLSRIKKIK